MTSSPVLVADLLHLFAPIRETMLQRHRRFAHAEVLRAIIFDVESGAIPDPRDLKRTLISKLCIPLNEKLSHAQFDLMYGALQLLANAWNTPQQGRFTDIFGVVTGSIYSLVASLKNNAAIHVEHFLSHAAIFLAAKTTLDKWPAVVERASVLMEQWGYQPTPAAVFAHCAHNLRIKCSRLPESDLHYDFVKHLRNRVKNKEIEQTDAFQAMTLAFGWREASDVVRILWPEVYQDYCEFEADLLKQTRSSQGDSAAIETAIKRGFTSPSGIPYVKTDQLLTQPAQFALSFPGSWTIGRTSVLCKVGRLRLLLDCGADDAGRFATPNPDLQLVDAMLISHAHQDHVGGLLPFYVSGVYDGPWYATPETRAAVELTLRDSVKIHCQYHGDAAFYKDSDVDLIMRHCIPVLAGQSLGLSPEVSARPLSAGHVPGSCQWLIAYGGKNVLFTGDFNTRRSLSVPPLEGPTDQEVSDTVALIAEGTYTLSTETFINAGEAKESLLKEITRATTVPVLVPVLSLGRAQEVCAALSGSGYRVGVFGLAARMTEALNQKVDSNITFDYRRPKAVRRDDYDVIVASSGCLQGGPSMVFHRNQSGVRSLLY